MEGDEGSCSRSVTLGPLTARGGDLRDGCSRTRRRVAAWPLACFPPPWTLEPDGPLEPSGRRPPPAVPPTAASTGSKNADFGRPTGVAAAPQRLRTALS